MMMQVMQVERPPLPKGMFCSPNGIVVGGKVLDASRKCTCKRMNDSEDCDDPRYDSHDPKCDTWCHEDQCACGLTCAAPGSIHQPLGNDDNEDSDPTAVGPTPPGPQ